MIVVNLVISFLVSFAVTFLMLPWLIQQMKSAGMTGKDMNKYDESEIPEMGGIAVVIGFFVGVYSLIAIKDVLDIGIEFNNFMMASMLTIIGIAFVGMLDDLIDMRQRIKAVLPFLFALPLGIYASSTMPLPFYGDIDFGLTMIFIVPFGITCAANSMNMLEGFNGLATGLGIIITMTLAVLCINTNSLEGLYLLLPLLGTLCAFIYYNGYPAKIFPGDTLTIFVGGTIGCAAIISNLRVEGIILLIPMIIEFFLKLAGNFKAECFSERMENGILIYEGEVQSLTHFVMKNFEVDERKLVRIFWFFETIIAFLVLTLSHFKYI